MIKFIQKSFFRPVISHQSFKFPLRNFVSVANISKVIEQYQTDNKVIKKNFQVVEQYISSRNYPFIESEIDELKTLLKMIMDYKRISHRQIDAQILGMLNKLLSLYPTKNIKFLSEVAILLSTLSMSRDRFCFEISKEVEKILSSEENHNKEFIYKNHKYLYSMKFIPFLRQTIEKNFKEMLNDSDEYYMITNQSYLIFLMSMRNSINEKKQLKIFQNIKVGEIAENRNEMFDYLDFIFETNNIEADECDKKITDILAIYKKNNDTLIKNLNDMFKKINHIYDRKLIKCYNFLESSSSLIKKIDLNKHRNEFLEIQYFITNKYRNLKCFSMVESKNIKGIFDSFHNYLFKFIDSIKDLTAKNLQSFKEDELEKLLLICNNCAENYIEDESLSHFFIINKDFFSNFSLKRENLFLSFKYLMTYIELCKNETKYNNNLKKLLNSFLNLESSVIRDDHFKLNTLCIIESLLLNNYEDEETLKLLLENSLFMMNFSDIKSSTYIHIYKVCHVNQILKISFPKLQKKVKKFLDQNSEVILRNMNSKYISSEKWWSTEYNKHFSISSQELLNYQSSFYKDIVFNPHIINNLYSADFKVGNNLYEIISPFHIVNSRDYNDRSQINPRYKFKRIICENNGLKIEYLDYLITWSKFNGKKNIFI